MEAIIVSGLWISVFILVVWAIYRVVSWIGPMPHDFYCPCATCRESQLRKEVMRREWLKQDREIQRAVDEVFTDSTWRPGERD